MNKKILLTLGTSIAIVGPIAGTVSCNDDKKGEKDIAFIVSTQDNPYFVKLKESAEAEAKKQGYNLTVFNSENDQSKEASKIDLVISQGFKTLILNGQDATQSAAGAKKAIDAGVEVIAVDRALAPTAKVWTTINSDNKKGAKELAGKVLDLIKDKKLSNITLFHLQGKSGEQNGIDRWSGVKEAINDTKYAGLIKNSILEARANYDRTSAKTLTQTNFTNNNSIKWINADNDEMALGAIMAQKSNVGLDPSNKIIVTGFDGNNDAKQAVQNGTLFGTVQQRPELLAQYAVRAAIESLGGKDFQDITKGTPIKADVEVIMKK